MANAAIHKSETHDLNEAAEKSFYTAAEGCESKEKIIKPENKPKNRTRRICRARGLQTREQ